MRLLAIDPGGTTGLAIYTLDDNGEDYLGFVAKSPGLVLKHIYTHPYDTIIVEDYNGQLISADGLMTVRLIGGIEALCYVLQIPRVLQFPQERDKYMPHAKQLVNNFGPDTRHARDAMAHLLCYQERLENQTLDVITARRRKLGEGK